MVTDKLTLALLSRLADAQLELATLMKGVTTACQGYPDEDLQRISEALEQIEALIAQIRTSIDLANTQGKLH
ncbi:hypothetical protein C206_08709 [Pseudomonas putida TRO1]|uniref:Uncharacterized protein n=3 Tax=Pseudomonas TaxID=286 RepID=A0AAP7FKD0_9PSED|nr:MULTISPECIES: hypothetical protein [Pseudomonas]HCI3895387.1 hypothetical protein [Pseudomonas aeruginosa]ELS0927288.1 hypothetical protein [Pseudomonas putida]ENY78051.1 hypothetical protein C206_08709 [Pseudomonas putida TRO1]OAH47908.1 hypothetical protein AYJ70_05860 [Pseudomonas monteilii]PKF25555.1 hypothetical protein CW309_16415 [Pseudomonas hunanensis]